MKKTENVRYTNQFYRPHRVGSNTRYYVLLVITLALVVSTVVLAMKALKKPDSEETSKSSETSVTSGQGGDSTSEQSGIVVATPAPTPATGPNELQNPNLFPATAMMDVQIGVPVAQYSPAERGVSQDVFKGNDNLGSFARESEIHMGDPLYYQDFAGILTFRGNNFRNCASWGYASIDTTKPEDQHFEKVWEFKEMQWKSTPLSSTWSWVGAGWTGQPLAVRWDYDLQQKMNMYPEKRSKQGLTEIILASQDGHVYFLDLDDGQKTRDPINVGATIKGTPAVDPRGYPILYVGQGDDNGTRGEVGYRIYSLFDGKMLHFQQGLDSRAYRSNWGACDSSPIIDAKSDTLIYPSENGMIYTVKLNTQFDANAGTVSIDPETVVYRYSVDGQSGGQFGIESSMSIYDHYGWCSDNGGNLICIDLNSMSMVWTRRLDDDSDVTPVIEEENGHVYLYIGTEVDWQNSAGGDYQGQAFTYKIDAMTGENVWQKSCYCYTHNGSSSSDDINGGTLGTPISGKKSISNLVIFSYCMTKNVSYGNALVAYDKSTGAEVWRYDWNTYTWSSPVDIYDEQGNAYIVVFDSQGQGHLVDGSTGVRIGLIQGLKQDTLGNFEASPIVVDDMIVIAQRSPAIYGVKVS
ncbi:MAG: PQQ-binding-like beta-propeller repeat protein [Clostridiales bacterium]|nr:PQQ-binding-like beta-propeller repeat protein [Clostridiales bacterium]